MAIKSKEFTPGPWKNSYAWLKCKKCGEVIFYNGTDFENAEAGAAYNVAKHTCPTTSLELQRVGAAMKQYRAVHAPMTFEEECKVYNEIMLNQNYL